MVVQPGADHTSTPGRRGFGWRFEHDVSLDMPPQVVRHLLARTQVLHGIRVSPLKSRVLTGGSRGQPVKAGPVPDHQTAAVILENAAPAQVAQSAGDGHPVHPGQFTNVLLG